jgi:hypothetical protein
MKFDQILALLTIKRKICFNLQTTISTKNEYTTAITMMIKDSETDMIMFLRESKLDKRDEILKDIRQKTIQESKYSKIIWDVINSDPNLSDREKNVALKISQIRNKYSALSVVCFLAGRTRVLGWSYDCRGRLVSRQKTAVFLPR